MRIIKRHSVQQSPTLVRRLSEDELRIMFSSSKKKQELLASLYGYWISCECNSPVTIKRLKASGHYYLARVPGRDEHHKHCPFYSLVTDTNNDPVNAKGNLNAYSFSMEIPTPSDNNVTESVKRANIVARTDKLYSLVASIIESSHVNQISLQHRPDYYREVRQIEKVAKLYTLGNKCLKDYLFFGFGKYKAALELLHKRSSAWIGRHKPQAIILGHIDSISKEEENWILHIKDGWDMKLQKGALLTRINGLFSLNKGPLLCAAVISCTSNKKGNAFYAVTRCFVSPVVSTKGFMLVDSDLERVAAKVAIGCILRKNNGSTTLSKPLIPSFIEGTAVLPDFLVKTATTTSVIEVMGKWDDELYQERKSKTVPLMNSLYGSVETIGKTTSKNKDAFYQECLDQFNKLIE